MIYYFVGPFIYRNLQTERRHFWYVTDKNEFFHYYIHLIIDTRLALLWSLWKISTVAILTSKYIGTIIKDIDDDVWFSSDYSSWIVPSKIYLPIGFHSSSVYITPLSVITFRLKKETIKRSKTEFNTRFYCYYRLIALLGALLFKDLYNKESSLSFFIALFSSPICLVHFIQGDPKMQSSSSYI